MPKYAVFQNADLAARLGEITISPEGEIQTSVETSPDATRLRAALDRIAAEPNLSVRVERRDNSDPEGARVMQNLSITKGHARYPSAVVAELGKREGFRCRLLEENSDPDAWG